MTFDYDAICRCRKGAGVLCAHCIAAKQPHPDEEPYNRVAPMLSLPPRQPETTGTEPVEKKGNHKMNWTDHYVEHSADGPWTVTWDYYATSRTDDEDREYLIGNAESPWPPRIGGVWPRQPNRWYLALKVNGKRTDLHVYVD